MLAPHPYVRAGGVGLKALGAGGKIFLKMLRRSSRTIVKHIVHENFLTKQVASSTNALVRKEFNITNGFVNLASEARTNHIIFGEKAGYGGHLWPGQQGKTPFPQSWGPDKIMHYVSDIATDPNISWEEAFRKPGLQSENLLRRYTAIGKREGVNIRVVVEPDGEGIITAYPRQ